MYGLPTPMLRPVRHYCLGRPQGRPTVGLEPLCTACLKAVVLGCCELLSGCTNQIPLRRGPTPQHGSKMVRFGSADLWTSAPGVKRVQRSDPPWSRGRPRPKKAPNGKSLKNWARSTFRGNLLFRVSTFKEGCVPPALGKTNVSIVLE